MREHFPGCIHAADDDIPLPEEGNPQLIDPIPWINKELVLRALSLFGDHKSAGSDDLKPVLLIKQGI